MAKDADWIAARITEARKGHVSVTDAAAARIEKLLRGLASERQLRPMELTDAAKSLIADMIASPPPEPEGKQ